MGFSDNSSFGVWGDLDENGLHGFITVNAWCPVGGTVCERLGDIVLLDNVGH